MIRQSNDTDIVRFLSCCYEEMDFASNGFDFDGQSVIKTINMSSENGGCFFEEFKRGELVGLFAAMIAPNIMDHNQNRGVEFIWHSLPSLGKKTRIQIMDKLLSSGIYWAAENNIWLSVNTSVMAPGAGRILERNGFKETEKVFVRSKSWV